MHTNRTYTTTNTTVLYAAYANTYTYTYDNMEEAETAIVCHLIYNKNEEETANNRERH